MATDGCGDRVKNCVEGSGERESVDRETGLVRRRERFVSRCGSV